MLQPVQFIMILVFSGFRQVGRSLLGNFDTTNTVKVHDHILFYQNPPTFQNQPDFFYFPYLLIYMFIAFLLIFTMTVTPNPLSVSGS